MKIINNIKKYKIIYLALIASLYLTAGPISEILQTESKPSSLTAPVEIMSGSASYGGPQNLKNNIILKLIYKLADKITHLRQSYGEHVCQKTKNKKKTQSEIIIDETTNLITTELKQSTQDITKILDTTVADGELRLRKGLKLRSQCKKKISATTDQLEQIINETIVKLETKDEDKNLLIKRNTEAFIEETKQEVYDIQKSMSAEMRKSLGKKPQVVFACTKNAKKQIAEFENKVITKIEKFSDKLKADIECEVA